MHDFQDKTVGKAGDTAPGRTGDTAPGRTGDTPEGKTVPALITDLLDTAGVTEQRSLITQLVNTSLGLGTDQTERLNLKISAAALQEMRAAFQVFAPFAGTPKVTIFGSARTALADPQAQQAGQVAAALAELGWMTVTGAGPGIMEAAARGAGAEKSLGVSIRLPFEEAPNEIHANAQQHVAMKYFFTRKLMLVKESRGFVCLPGGFGTLDEAFELLTLQQTGKMVPVPIVFLDAPGGTFWRNLAEFARNELERGGLITTGDLDRVLITDSVAVAVDEVIGFWRNYDSLRWFGEHLFLRIRTAPTPEELAALNREFAHLLVDGSIELCDAHPLEVKEQDVPGLPRLRLHFNQYRIGELHRLIRALNKLGG